MGRLAAIFICLVLATVVKGDCDADVDAYFQGLDLSNPANPKPWALQMFDSSSKFTKDGISEGTFLFNLGNFDQCVAVDGPNGEDGNSRFIGQYCLFKVGLTSTFDAGVQKYLQMHQNLQGLTNLHSVKADEPSNSGFPTYWGVCAPSSCGLDGVKRVAEFNMQFLAGSNANVTVWKNSCYYEGSMVVDAASWCFIGFSIVLICLILVSTVLEYFQPNSGWNSVLSAFSLRQTLILDLLRLPKSSKPGHLGCLNGIRTLSMLWVVLCHTYSYVILLPGQNLFSTLSRWYTAVILNGMVSVDTFFFLSGLLTVYVPLMDLAKGRKFNVLQYYVYGYLRITIPMAVAMWFTSSVILYFGKGPIWGLTNASAVKMCQNHWWENILYVSNYLVDISNYCMGHVWYLCVDMQLALLAPLIIYPLMKWPKYGLIAIFALTLGSMAAIFAVTYTESLPWTSQITLAVEVTERYWSLIYTNTPMRATPYLIGMALGYFLSQKYHVPVPKWGVALGWIACTALALTVIFLILIPYSEDYVQDNLAAAFYASLHKPAWSLSLCWIVWACVNGYGGFINDILSWKYFVPLSKLTFCGYLIHIPVLQIYAGLQRAPYFITHFENLYTFSGILVLTLPFTLFLYLAVEAPSLNMLRLAFKKRSHKTDQETDQAEKTPTKKA